MLAGLDSDAMFSDLVHLNRFGQEIATAALVEQLKVGREPAMIFTSFEFAFFFVAVLAVRGFLRNFSCGKVVSACGQLRVLYELEHSRSHS